MKNFLRKQTRTGEGTAPVAPAGFGHRTPEQIQDALVLAHAARQESKQVLADLRERKVTLEEVLDPGYTLADRASKMRVAQLLRAVPGVSPGKAEKIMNEVGIMSGRKAGALSYRQQSGLLAALP